MRVRSRSSGGVVSDVWKTMSTRLVYTQPTWNTQLQRSLHYTDAIEEYIEDIPTPNFAKQISNGAIINNPFKKTTRKTIHPNIVNIHHRTTQLDHGVPCGYDWQGLQVPFHGYPKAPLIEVEINGTVDPECAAMKANVYNLAVTSAHANVNESEMLWMATVAESRKSVESMSAILFRVIKLARNIRKLNIRGILDELKPKELAERYMEVRYAVRPLLYDAANLVAALEKKRGVERQTYRGYASDSLSRTDSVGEWQTFYETVTSINRSFEYEVSAKAGVLCDVVIDEVTVFGVDKFVETMWELTPFSFIVDWFANVGDTIAALTPNAGVNQLASWVTLKETSKATNSSGSTRSTTNWPYENISTLGAFSYGYEEQVLERFKDPTISLWPQSKLRLDGYKLLDLGIILRGILR